jgi:hypothetical protein
MNKPKEKSNKQPEQQQKSSLLSQLQSLPRKKQLQILSMLLSDEMEQE